MMPQKKDSVKWKNVFVIALFVFTAGLVWNAINYSDVKKYKTNYLVMKDSCEKVIKVAHNDLKTYKTLYNYVHGRNKKLIDSCQNMRIAYLNGTFKKCYDSTSTFWYVSYETNKLSGYDVIKLSSKTFSLVEAQNVIKKLANIKEPFLNVIYFNQVSEKCWAEYQNSQRK